MGVMFEGRYVRFYARRVVLFAARFVLSLLVVAATTEVLYELRVSLSAPTIALLFLVPVGLAATLWGLAPGICAALAAFLALNYFFTQPQFTLAVTHTQDLLELVVFLVVTVAISQLMGRSQSNLREAQAREREVVHLYELMAGLASLRNQDAIARATAARISEVFHASAVEVVLQPQLIRAPQVYRVPAGTPLPDAPPDQVIALMTPRALLGELHVWRAGVMTPADDRLLNTFASQAALAIERVLLAQTETRARVLEESDRLKSALLSSVSHELRTPLATIKAAVSSLLSGNVSWDSAARADLLAAVEEETDHLNRLVGNLLDMSRIEAGVLKPQRQWNILADIAAATATRMRRIAGDHVIDIDISEDLPLVPVDHAQMDQVFANLIGNGLKYAPPGTTVRVKAQAQGRDALLVEVSNQGPHVPDEDLDRIFDKFYRVTSADRVTGTGLGLSICKGIIEAHGGHIWAQNLPNGFAFYFTLPLAMNGERAPELPVEAESP
jgi:two-component system, OmpR family, sensor histidine kinase KdpD